MWIGTGQQSFPKHEDEKSNGGDETECVYEGRRGKFEPRTNATDPDLNAENSSRALSSLYSSQFSVLVC
jgi:hypothetical protein